MPVTPPPAPPPHSDGKLHASTALWRGADDPAAPAPLAAGLHKLAFGGGRRARLYVPAAPATDPPPSLLVLLHGATGLHGGGDRIALAYAARQGALLLIPDALSTSWDVIRGGWGPDLAFIDRALAWVMRRYQVDPGRIAIAGFSDGASYALSVGLMNGDLFSDILAFSPGFMMPLRRVGRPRVFVGHGAADRVLPVERGRAIAQALVAEGYEVEYKEFGGAHEVQAPLAEAALARATRR